MSLLQREMENQRKIVRGQNQNNYNICKIIEIYANNTIYKLKD